jgi:hypothetical protein
MNKFLKENLLIIAVMLCIIALIIIRNTGTGKFRYNAEKWAKASVDGSNIVTPVKVTSLTGNVMILEINQKRPDSTAHGIKVVSINPGSLMEMSIRKLIKKNNGPVILHSADYATSAKAWMVLSQSGLKNLFILADDADIEAGKGKFRPDTHARPESE